MCVKLLSENLNSTLYPYICIQISQRKKFWSKLDATLAFRYTTLDIN